MIPKIDTDWSVSKQLIASHLMTADYFTVWRGENHHRHYSRVDQSLISVKYSVYAIWSLYTWRHSRHQRFTFLLNNNCQINTLIPRFLSGLEARDESVEVFVGPVGSPPVTDQANDTGVTLTLVTIAETLRHQPARHASFPFNLHYKHQHSLSTLTQQTEPSSLTISL